MKISVGLVFFLFLFSASVAAQTIPPPKEPSRSPPLRELGREDWRGAMGLPADRSDSILRYAAKLHTENEELKKLVEVLQKKVELLEQSTKTSSVETKVSK
ncbi:MAG TPA: hypothetical protein VI585_11890 [Candidatus Binatia bacterium]